jgi:hypothetical protein
MVIDSFLAPKAQPRNKEIERASTGLTLQQFSLTSR